MAYLLVAQVPQARCIALQYLYFRMVHLQCINTIDILPPVVEIGTYFWRYRMSNYLVRVELHGATYVNYEHLHKAMAAKGFVRNILGGDGKTYALPTAEYVASTPQGGATVRTQAEAAAASTRLNHAILVVDFSQAWWNGLPQV
jgi:hypothetical protein